MLASDHALFAADKLASSATTRPMQAGRATADRSWVPLLVLTMSVAPGLPEDPSGRGATVQCGRTDGQTPTASLGSPLPQVVYGGAWGGGVSERAASEQSNTKVPVYRRFLLCSSGGGRYTVREQFSEKSK